MRIFDGVEVNPTPGPNAHGVQSWISIGLLFVNSFLEAEKCRQERVAAAAGGVGTLDEVMAQTGLKIPNIEEALAQLMGGGVEAKQAASMIVNSPDPTSLLQQFAKRFGLGEVANSGPMVTPPPAEKPHEPANSVPTDLPKQRPDFTREARQAAATGTEPAPPLPKYRPDFTREAREAVKTATAAREAPTLSKVNPDSTRTSVPGPDDGATVTAAMTPRASLVTLVERHLNALRQRMKAHETELDMRLKRAEIELAALREELQQREQPVAVPAIEPNQPTASSVEAHEPEVESDVALSKATKASEPVAVASGAEVVLKTESVESDSAPVEPLEVSTEPLPAATEEEVVRAVELISEFSEEADVRHQHGLARVLAVEHQVQALRLVIRGEAAAIHG